MLTADEVILAGGKLGSDIWTYYLYTGEYYWLGAPSHFSNIDAYEFEVASFGYLYSSYYVSTTYGVRPSISLKPGFSIIGNGDGTVNNPYIVS